ncbi:MAG: adenylate/guanylate cyclase domain-containing protein [Proteobacteria bacterium]|nr:adenylate/guanylate cyclase domain-containing protein [Pseudomonadota bacterium]
MGNSELIWLDKLNQRAQQISEEKTAAEKRIREGFKEKVIIFMDVVGSAEFKIQYPDNPEVWILRVKQFSDLLATAIIQCNGKVVKYIGDEVMASFDNINDAKNLVARVSEIEETLKKGTGFETRIKVTADFGLVYELDFENHSVPDPQGSPVDRCARIAKYTTAGEVLSSAAFVEKTPQLNWKKVGVAELKGLGKQVIYQLEKVTVSLDEKIEIKKTDFERLNEELQDIRTENSQFKEINKQLRAQLVSTGQKPVPALEDDTPEDKWDPVTRAIDELKKVINKAPVSSKYYARFIFLDHAEKGFEEYNKFEGKVFDDLIESNLVVSEDDRRYYLNDDHPKNKQVSKLLANIERELDKYLSANEQDPDDLFEWKTTDPEFWENYIGYNVLFT